MFLLIVFGVFALEVLVVLQAGYTGIILGHKANSGKMIKSIVYGFVLYIFTSALSLLVLYIAGLFKSDVMQLFTMNSLVDISTVKFVLYLGIIFYLIVTGIYFILDIKLFKQGVNVN